MGFFTFLVFFFFLFSNTTKIPFHNCSNECKWYRSSHRVAQLVVFADVCWDKELRLKRRPWLSATGLRHVPSLTRSSFCLTSSVHCFQHVQIPPLMHQISCDSLTSIHSLFLHKVSCIHPCIYSLVPLIYSWLNSQWKTCFPSSPPPLDSWVFLLSVHPHQLSIPFHRGLALFFILKLHMCYFSFSSTLLRGRSNLLKCIWCREKFWNVCVLKFSRVCKFDKAASNWGLILVLIIPYSSSDQNVNYEIVHCTSAVVNAKTS